MENDPREEQYYEPNKYYEPNRYTYRPPGFKSPPGGYRRPYTIPNMQLNETQALLQVQPGLPTPIELCSYDHKVPSGLLHVTPGNQTVEFLNGVANLPSSYPT